MSDEDRQVRPFADFLGEQRNGLTHSELSDALNELLEAVTDTGKTGKLTLEITVKPEGQMVIVKDKIVVKTPEADRDPSLYFVDQDCNLTRDNPSQPRLPLRDVSAPPPDKEVDPETGEITEVAP